VKGLLGCLKARPNDVSLVTAAFYLMDGLVTLTGSGGGWEKDAGRVTVVWAGMLVRREAS